MEALEDRRVGFLNAVNEFSKARAYRGIMPRRLVRSCDEVAVRESFEQGLVALYSAKFDDGSKIEGMVLTRKGMDLLAGA
jgi:hypothetical protein